VLESRLASRIRRPVDELRERLPFGTPARAVDMLASYQEAGLEWAFVWPVADELEQLTRFSDQVIAPLRS
jgi:alkanesulfonate monooxygenase SsuD/methylene tetrahydromethanopterin reductase-like flavin-dependent oxidoreductase (luciferase family)